VIEAEFLKPFGQMREHFEPAGMHPIQHVHEASLDTARSVGERRALGEHVQLLGTILLGQLIARPLVVLKAVVRPGRRYPVIAP
jgi:hypothetical protein